MNDSHQLLLALVQERLAPAGAAAERVMPSGALLWSTFFAIVLGLLVLDLFVLHKKSRPTSMREAAITGLSWVGLALLFCGWVRYEIDARAAKEFLAGYVVELSLSFDNLFVFIIIFRYFRVPQEQQHRVLFWGILGALVMRAVFILAGIELLERFHWISYVFGFLLLYTGVKLLREKAVEFDPEKSLFLRVAKKVLPLTASDPRGKFFVVEGGRGRATSLFLCLLTVEASDVVFAVDSIPAILGITTERFIVYTSNVFAILGLRSFFVLLALLMNSFRYLSVGLALVLIFIGAKMLLLIFPGMPPIDINWSLAVVFILLGGSVAASLLIKQKPEEKPDAKDPLGVEEAEKRD